MNDCVGVQGMTVGMVCGLDKPAEGNNAKMHLDTTDKADSVCSAFNIVILFLSLLVNSVCFIKVLMTFCLGLSKRHIYS